MRVKLPEATTPGTLLFVHEHTEGRHLVFGGNLPLLITTAGEKGCAAFELSVSKKGQPDLIERGPAPPRTGDPAGRYRRTAFPLARSEILATRISSSL